MEAQKSDAPRDSVTGMTEDSVPSCVVSRTERLSVVGVEMSALQTPFVTDLNRPLRLCGRPMEFVSVEPSAADPNTEIRIFDCEHCRQELRIARA
jgi:hypothetical protein